MIRWFYLGQKMLTCLQGVQVGSGFLSLNDKLEILRKTIVATEIY